MVLSYQLVFQFRDMDEPLVSHYELQGDTVVVQMEAVSVSRRRGAAGPVGEAAQVLCSSQVPSGVFRCVEFRLRSRFVVRGSSRSVLSIYEPQDKGEGRFACWENTAGPRDRGRRSCFSADREYVHQGVLLRGAEAAAPLCGRAVSVHGR